MKYTEEFFIKRTKETTKLINFLQECKYSGSWDTKVDLSVVITTMSQSNLIIGELCREIKRLEDKIKSFDVTPSLSPIAEIQTKVKKEV